MLRHTITEGYIRKTVVKGKGAEDVEFEEDEFFESAVKAFMKGRKAARTPSQVVLRVLELAGKAVSKGNLLAIATGGPMTRERVAKALSGLVKSGKVVKKGEKYDLAKR